MGDVGADKGEPPIKILAKKLDVAKCHDKTIIHSDMLLMQEKALPNIKDNAGGGRQLESERTT